MENGLAEGVDGLKVKKRRLKEDAVPSQWPGTNIPGHHSVKAPPRRDLTLGTSSAELASQAEREQLEYQHFLEIEGVSTLKDVLDKLDPANLPNGISIIRKTSCVIFMYIEELGVGQINVLFHLTIFEDCSFKMEIQNVPLPNSAVFSVTREDRIQFIWEITSILAILKSSSETFNEEKSSLEYIINDFRLRIAKLALEDNEKQKKIGFLLEQLSLITQPKPCRNYSSDMVACASMWRNTSPTLYDQILKDGYLSLPCSSWLKNLNPVSFGLTEGIKKYLNLRIKNLSARERMVVLAFDEIYVNQQVEFHGGRFFALKTEDHTSEDLAKNPGKTVLCFHVSSLFGPFEEMVAQYPVMKLDSTILRKCYNSVMDALHKVGFHVVVLSSDNATLNWKFFLELCNGKLKPRIPHPHLEEQDLFLLFDPVQGLKNIFNNFQSRDRFMCPDFGDLSSIIFPTFKHVRELFELERGKPVKMAYKLTKKAISSKNIDNTNVKLAQSVFDDSTVQAMEFYIGNVGNQWGDTLKFLKIINRWWKIVNTKISFLHVKTRDDGQAPIQSVDDENFKFLGQFHEWLEDWDKMLGDQGTDRSGFTPLTMMALMSSTKTFQEIARYILTRDGIEFVLLGKCQADQIEGRFGWFRQLSGVNYYISCRQLLESDKFIEAKSLVKFSKLNLIDVQTTFESMTTSEKETIECVAFELETAIDFDPVQHLQDLEDKNIVFYVAGYLARFMTESINCLSCKDLLTVGKEPLVLNFDMKENDLGKEDREKFLDQVNLSGLSRPSDVLYICCVHAWALYNNIMKKEATKKIILKSNHSREVFVETFMNIVSSCSRTVQIIETSCANGHPFRKHAPEIVKRIFNVFRKNLTAKNNSEIWSNKQSKSKSISAAKMNKLQSTC